MLLMSTSKENKIKEKEMFVKCVESGYCLVLTKMSENGNV